VVNASELEELQKAYNKTFSNQEGKLVLADLRQRCFAYAPTNVPGDPYGTHINEGMRNVLLHIETKMKMALLTQKKENQ